MSYLHMAQCYKPQIPFPNRVVGRNMFCLRWQEQDCYISDSAFEILHHTWLYTQTTCSNHCNHRQLKKINNELIERQSRSAVRRFPQILLHNTRKNTRANSPKLQIFALDNSLASFHNDPYLSVLDRPLHYIVGSPHHRQYQDQHSLDHHQ